MALQRYDISGQSDCYFCAVFNVIVQNILLSMFLQD